MSIAEEKQLPPDQAAEAPPEPERMFMVWCVVCQRRHRMAHSPCPECGVYTTPQPVSEAVSSQCGADYACDGCQAYREHQA